MNTLTKKDKLALQVSLALVAGMFSLTPVVQGAPVLKEVVAGGAKVHQTTANVTAVVPSNNVGVSNNVINWSDFSVGSSEKVIFDATDAAGSSYAKQNNYLNVVTGEGTSYINGAMKGGKNVYLVNPNGVIMGEKADIDVGNLYVSTKNINPENFANTDLNQGVSVLANSGNPEAEVVNMGKIQANSVYAEGTEIRFLNTKNVQYKSASNVSDTSSSTLPPLSSENGGGVVNGASYGSEDDITYGVILNGTNYVSVGYERTPSGTTATYTDSDNDGVPPASELGYRHATANVSIDDYMLVRNTNELKNINNSLTPTSNYMLANDIKYSSQTAPNHTPIGNSSTPFKGKFEGNYFKITNMYPYASEAGLFGVTQDATIRNVGVVDAIVVATQYGGNIIGVAYNTDVSDVYAKKSGTAKIAPTTNQIGTSNHYYSNAKIGGIVGYAASGSTINGVYNNTDVYNGAGLVGALENSTLSNAYNDGSILITLVNSTATHAAEHYSVYDSSSGSTITNVYNTGMTTNKSGMSSQIDGLSQNVATLVSKTGPSGNSATTTVIDANSDVAKLSSSYAGIFASGETKNKTWRIYEGHSRPLLRSFLKANGHGTIPVTYSLGLFADNNPSTQAKATIPGYSSNKVTYNGYYVGASSVKSDTSRGITSGIEAASTRIKNADQSATLFYSTNQDGYDLADSTITMTQRNLVPPYDMTISKVYDGTSDATPEMREAFTTGDNAVDVAQYYIDNNVLVETGLVKTNVGGTMTSEKVSLNDDAITSANFYVTGTDNPAINVSQAPDAEHTATVNVIWSDSTINTNLADDTDGDGTRDNANYFFDVSNYTNGTNTVNGYITPRPVYVQLQTETGIDKTYDKSNVVVYKDSNWALDESETLSAASNVHDISSVAGPALGKSDYGLTEADVYNGAVLSKGTPYYTSGTGTGTVPNVGKGYTANYPVTFTSNDSNFEVGNYEVYAYTPGTGEGETATDPIASLLDTINGSFLMKGTGNITQRIVTTTDAKFYYKDGEDLYEPANAKYYDGTSDYFDENVALVGNQNRANYVDFGTGENGNYITSEQAVAHAGEAGWDTGIISGDEGDFNFQLDTNQTKFYNDASQTEANKATEANAPSSGVDKRANSLRYAVLVNGSSTVQNNYKLVDGNGNTVSMTDNVIPFYEEARIEKRPLYLKLNPDGSYDKTYDGSAKTLDVKNGTYDGITDIGVGNVLYDDSVASSFTKLGDDTAWSIDAEYQPMGSQMETQGKDVYKVNGTVTAKNIEYKVKLTGDDADNYILYVPNNTSYTSYDQSTDNPAVLAATGIISPVTINKVTFATASKYYDHTANVGAVNGEIQSDDEVDNHIRITDVTDAAGNSVLVTGENVGDVFGGERTVVGETVTYQYIDANGYYNRVDSQGEDVIKGRYGLNNTDTGAAFTEDIHARNGIDRKVQYTGVANALTTDNYKLADSSPDVKFYGQGNIKPLKITSLSYGNITRAEKVYDGNEYLILMNGTGDSATPTTYKVTYNPDGTVNSDETIGLTTDNVGTNTIGTLTGSNTALHISNVPLDYTVNADSYFVKVDGNTTTTTSNTDANHVKYSLTVYDASGLGDYALANNGGDGTYTADVTNAPGVAWIIGEGTITKRHVFVNGVPQTKTYDGTTNIYNTGNQVVAMSAGNDTEGVTGLLGNDAAADNNSSTAVFVTHDGATVAPEDANYGVDYVTNTERVFRDENKTVQFTPSLVSGGGNYAFYYDGADVAANNNNGVFTTNEGHKITQKNLQVTFKPIEKVYDRNDYVKDNGDYTVSLLTGTGLGLGDPDYATGVATGQAAQATAGVLTGDTVTLTTRNTSQFLPFDGQGNETSAYANDANHPTHNVRYDLEVSGGNTVDYLNYRLVDGNSSALTVGTYTENEGTAQERTYVGATGSGTGTIDPASVNASKATFGDITKVYDGTPDVLYDHTALYYNGSQAYDAEQAVADNNYHVTGLTLSQGNVSYDMTGKYNILEAIYDSANVGNRSVTYTFQITDTEFLQNVSLDNALPNRVNDNTFKITTSTTTGTDNDHVVSITAKNVYATLNSTGQNANPTKTYNRENDLLNVATVGNTTTVITAAKPYVDITGLRNADSNNYSVGATYNTVNVIRDDAGNVQEGQHDVNYLVGLTGTGASNYKLKSNDTGSTENDDNTVNLLGKGTIKPKDISIKSTYVATKTYDAATDVKLTAGDGIILPNLVVDGVVSGDDIAVATSGTNAIVGTYGNMEGNTFTPNANVALNDDDSAGYKAVQYSNVKNSLVHSDGTLLGNLLDNYNLVSGNGGVYVASDGENSDTVTFATGKGMINKLALSSIKANVDTVNKVYDGNTSLSYTDHTAENGYIGNQIQSEAVTAADKVNYLVLTPVTGSVVNLYDGYTVDDWSHFNTADADTGKTITYKFNISKDVMRSFDLSNFSLTANNVTAGSNGTYDKIQDVGGNTITAKDVQVTLSEAGAAANPTREYNGDSDVFNVTYDAATADKVIVTATKAKDYVSVTDNGFINNDTFTVQEAAYDDKDVIVGNESGHVVSYTVGTASTNYRLVDADGNSNDANTVTLTGKGTINPKELKFQAGYTQKTYDNTTSILPRNEQDEKYISNEANYTVDNPKYQFVGLVNNETLTPDADSITGDYVVAGSGEGYVNGYKKDSHVEATLNADGSVASVDYKAVQYTGLQNAFENATGTANKSNYVLNGAVTAGGSGAEYFDTDNGTAVYGKDLENGKIFRKVFNAEDITTEWKDGASKTYDTTSEVKDYDKWFTIHTIASETDGVEYQLGYNLGNYGAQYTEADNVNKTVDDAGEGYNLRYQVTGFSGETTIDFDLQNLADGAFTGYYNSKDNIVNGTSAPVYGEISKYKIRGNAEDGNIKIYDGGRGADASYFKFNSDDEVFMRADGGLLADGASLHSLINVTAEYDHENANISPYLKSKDAPGEYNVTYTLASIDGINSLKNYELDEGNDYIGTGDIRQRKVYVVDKGGEVVVKPYDGDTALPTGSNPGSRFKLSTTDNDAKTGIVEGEEDIVLNNDAITGGYVSKNVAREAGAVVNTAVKYQNFALKDNDTTTGGILSNYYLTTKDSSGTATVTGQYGGVTNVAYGTENNNIVITEKKGGRITPKEIAVNVVNSPEKEYDRDTAVLGKFAEGKEYASAYNLAVKVDGNVVEGAVNGNVLTIKDADTKDSVGISFKSAAYTDRNAGTGNKASKYNLSWSNGNYELVGESTNTNGTSGDTLVRGYDAKSGTLTATITDYEGTINPRMVDVASVDNVVKIYDGNNKVISAPNFTIKADDKAILEADGLGSALTISGQYDNKNANIDPAGNARGGKDVSYKLAWKEGVDHRNYTLATENNADEDFVGKGDIRRRKVYVVDNGGDVLTKTYDGTTSLLKGADLSGRFDLETAAANTGIVDSDVVLKNDDIRGAYVSKNVVRDENGNVFNTAVNFQGFGLEDIDGTDGDETGNYYLTTRNRTGTAPLTASQDGNETSVIYGSDSTGVLITEEKGGRIEPKTLYADLTAHPVKVYDGTAAVKGDYATLGNVKVDGTQGRKNAVALTNTNNSSVAAGDTVNLTMSKAPYYNDVHVQNANKATYELSIDNPNYDLNLAKGSDDTLTGTSYSDGKTSATIVTAGQIIPRTLTVTAVQNASKVYDGNTAVEEAANNLALGNLASTDNKNVLGFIANGAYYDETGTALDGNAYASEAAAEPINHMVKYSGFAIANSPYASDYVFESDVIEGSGTIERKALTITAEPQTVKVRDAMPDFTGSVSGLVSSDSGLAERFSFAPYSTTTTDNVGTYAVYGWYSNRTEGIFGKNYTFAQAESNLTALTVEPDNQDIGYIDKPVVPDSNVYQNVSKDANDSGNREASAAIQYGDNGVGTVAENDDSSSTGSIAIELAEVVNLLGGDVASDGNMSLVNKDISSKNLSVESTDEGYLSVGKGNGEGSIGIEREDGNGEGVAEISNSDDRLVPIDQFVREDKDYEEDDDEDSKDDNGSAKREAKAAITYGDVA